MSFPITVKDFGFFLKQFSYFAENVGSLSTIDMTGVLSSTYFSVPLDNGLPHVLIPLVAACHGCDSLTETGFSDTAVFTYNTTNFDAKLVAEFNAWEDYFANYHNDPEVNSINSYMMKEGLSVSSSVDSYYFSLTNKHFAAGNIYKPENTLHYTSTYSSSTGLWTGVYTTQTYVTLYNINSTTGSQTKPQLMKITNTLSDLLIQAVFETTGDDYIFTNFFPVGTTFITEVPVLKLKSLTILNSVTDDLKEIAVTNNSTITVKYTVSGEDTSSLTLIPSSTSVVVDGSVKTGDEDYLLIDDNDFYHKLTAIPDAGYYFDSWTSGNTQYNPLLMNNGETLVPVFAPYSTIDIIYLKDGVSYTGTDFITNLNPTIPSDGIYYKPCFIYPTIVIDESLYSIDALVWEDSEYNTSPFYSGEMIQIESGVNYTITVSIKSIAQITLTSTAITDPGYTKNLKPDTFWSFDYDTYKPNYFVGDTINIKAYLTDSLPASIYVFKNWTGSLDYKAILPKTLASTNTFNAEFLNLGASPIENTITFTKTGTATVQDLTNLDSSGNIVSLTSGDPYAVYDGSYISLQLTATGSSAVWTIDLGDGYPSIINDLTYQLDIDDISANITIDVVVTP